MIKAIIGFAYYISIWVGSMIIGGITANYAITGLIEIYIQPVFCVRLFLYIIFSAITFKGLGIIMPKIFVKETLKYVKY